MVLVSLLLAAPAVAFWLWLVIVPARVAILCPEGCECDPRGHYVDCSRKSLTSVSFIRLKNVRVLWLQRNNITVLENDSFVSLTELNLLDISYCKLRRIELGTFNMLTKLTRQSMQHNEISELLKGTFENMSSLEILDLSFNKINHLNISMFSGFGAFNGLTKLTRLKIMYNQISEILPDTFENMSSLENLDLSFNKINHLNRSMFSGSGEFNGLTKLTRLNMFSNKISEILPGTFENMDSLENLRLRHNKIDHLDSAVFSGLFKLKHVDLSANKLQYLQPHTFLGLPNIKRLSLENNRELYIPNDRYFMNSHSLSELDIKRCNISSLSVDSFAKVTALTSLDISHNNLRTVDINILRALPELSKLYLNGNPLQCDCQLQEVWRWCEDRNIESVYWSRVPECDTPSEVTGMWWWVLERGLCLEGNIEYFGDYNKTSYNETDVGEQKFKVREDYIYEFFKQYQITIYAFPFIFGTTGNVILLIIMICNKDMRTVPNMYILNLAISDMLYITVFLSEACAYRITGMWIDNEFKCVIFPFFRRMSVGLSAYSVALYSFQRYRETVSPFQVRVSSQPKWRGIVARFCGV